MAEKEPHVTERVLYLHPSTKDRSKPHLKSPALILAVNEDGTVDLDVSIVTGGHMFRPGVEQGQDEYQWMWPEHKAKR